MKNWVWIKGAVLGNINISTSKGRHQVQVGNDYSSGGDSFWRVK